MKKILLLILFVILFLTLFSNIKNELKHDYNGNNDNIDYMGIEKQKEIKDTLNIKQFIKPEKEVDEDL